MTTGGNAMRLALPATSWAEHSGTYVNAKGLRQVADKAIEPQGLSQPAWKHLAALATTLGAEPGFSKLKDVRAKLGAADPAPEVLPTTSTQAV